MAKTIQTAIEAGSRMAPAKFYIKITPDGPYLLYGNPPMDQETIVPVSYTHLTLPTNREV